MYFQRFPFTYYTLDDNKTVQIIPYIFLRIKFSDELKNNYALYDEYDIKDNETPEILADRVYGDSTLHWLILHLNDIIDPRFDWPQTTNNLIKYCQNKYTNINAAHHYIDANGFIVNSTAVGATPVSNFRYEDQLNENRRRIKLLKPQYIETVKREFARKIESING